MPHQVTRLLAVRHGETAWNTEARIQGHIDIPLNEQGHWQAERVAQALADEGIDAIYSSDLQRALHTAQAIARHADKPLLIDQALRERCFGRLEGKTPDEVAAQWPEEAQRWRERDPGYGPEGGESLQIFYERCREALTRLAHQHVGQTIAVVAHGGVLDCFYRMANHLPLETPRTWKINNVSINRLLYSPDGFSMLAWGDCRHIDDAAMDEKADGIVFTRV